MKWLAISISFLAVVLLGFLGFLVFGNPDYPDRREPEVDTGQAEKETPPAERQTEGNQVAVQLPESGNALEGAQPVAPTPGRAWTHSTEQFGFFRVNVADDFRLAALCTVSKGEVQGMGDYVNLIPEVGGLISKIIAGVSLDSGEAFCGLSHGRGNSPIFSQPASTNGFELLIKTYANGAVIGGGSPRRFCKLRPYPGLSIFGINNTGKCYEKIELSDNVNDAMATGVSACIEITGNSRRPTKSLVIFAGDVPDNVSNQWVGSNGSLRDVGCSQRDY